MGKRVEGRREMDLIPRARAALGGGGKGRLLPRGPWLMALISKPIWGLVQSPGRMVASGGLSRKMYSLNPWFPSILSLFPTVAHLILSPF